MKKTRISVFGSYNQDLVMYTQGFPKPKETLKNGTFQMFPGGKGANQAHAAALAANVNRSDENWDVFFLGKIGKDSFGHAAENHFKKAHIKTEKLLRDERLSTGCAMIMVEESTGQNSIVVASGANGNITEADIDSFKEIIKISDMIVMQFENNVDATIQIAKIANSFGKPVLLNPAPSVTPFPNDLLNCVSIIAPNEIEAGDILGYQINNKETVEKGLMDLLNLFPNLKFAIITMGEQGVYAIERKNNGIVHIPAYNVKAIDTTGAGDAFIGAFSIAFFEYPKNLIQQLKFASAAAAINVTRKGAAIANPTRDEIMTQMEEL